jgi:hypothetical protein
MDTLLQQFETPIAIDGTTYVAFLYGRNRADGMWEGRITFERAPDGARFTTPVETTQSNAEAVLYWATGLTDAYFEGALRRAMDSSAAPSSEGLPAPAPLVTPGASAATRAARREDIERAVLDIFTTRNTKQVLTRDVFDALPHANADVVRALEHLEKGEQLIVRKTEEGNDWLFLR